MDAYAAVKIALQAREKESSREGSVSVRIEKKKDAVEKMKLKLKGKKTQ